MNRVGPNRLTLLTIALLLLVCQGYSQNLTAYGTSVLSIDKMVREYMFNGNKSVFLKNIHYSGGYGAVGAYTAVGTPFGTTSGMMLSTGSIYMANGPFLKDTTSTCWNVNPDFDVEGLYRADSLTWPPMGQFDPKTFDPAYIEFDVATPGNGLTFNFQYGSYEYDDPRFTDTSNQIARDISGILIQGRGFGDGFNYVNIGTVTEYPAPGPIPLPPAPPPVPLPPYEVPINSWSVNNGPNGSGPCMRCDKFYDNATKNGGVYPFTSMPGFTGVFTKTVNVLPCDTYHVKIFIADVGDCFMDSHFFFNIETVDPPVYEVLDKYQVGLASYQIDTTAFEDCDYAEIRIERYTNLGNAATTNLWYTGSAVSGVDYYPLPTTINFAVGQRTVVIPINAKKTPAGTPDRTIVVNNLNEICGSVKYFTKSYVLKKDILNFKLPPDTSLCEGEKIVLNASNTPPAEYYVWNDNTSGPFYTVTKSGQYSVRARIGTCLRSDTMNVYYKPLVKFTLGPDTSICYKDSMKLDPKLSLADTNIKYKWYDNTTKPTKNVGSSGTYNLRVSRLGCHTYDTVNVSVKPLPAVVLGPDTNICYKNSANFIINATTDPFNEMLWSTGSTGMNTLVNQSGTYVVRAKSNGCFNYDTIKVQLMQTPPLDLRDTLLCEKYPLTLRAPKGVGYTYLWSNGSLDSTILVNGTGKFVATVTNGYCVAKDSATVTRKPSPKTNLGNDTALCKGQNILLDASSTDLVTWQWGGAGSGCGSNKLCTTSGTGNYIVTLTSLTNGCIGKDTIYFYAKPLPDPKLGPDTSICNFTSVTLEAKGPYDSVFWQDGSTDPTFTYDKPGIYWARAYRDNCTNLDSVKVTLSAASPPFILSNDTGFCKGNTVVYNVSCPNCTYLWEDNSTVPVKTFNKGGTHTVTISNQKCKRVEEIKINEIIPASVFPKDTFVCHGIPLVLKNPIPGATSKWSNNTTGNSIIVNDPGGKYKLELNNKGCIYTDEIEVKYVGAPVVDLGPDISSCSSNQLILDATNPGNTEYLWSDGSTNPTLEVKEANTYKVSVTRCNITVTDEVFVDYMSKEMVFYVPSAFTPADDNSLNDVLLPQSTVKQLTKYSFSVYNKWGQKMFESDDFNKGWDGTYNGVKQPGDVYIWIIDAYSDCYSDPYYHKDGNVTLLK